MFVSITAENQPLHMSHAIRNSIPKVRTKTTGRSAIGTAGILIVICWEILRKSIPVIDGTGCTPSMQGMQEHHFHVRVFYNQREISRNACANGLVIASYYPGDIFVIFSGCKLNFLNMQLIQLYL